MNYWIPLSNLIVGVVIAFFSSWLTVKFALKRFYSEKWFERRVAAYTAIIEALHIMKQCTDRQLRAAETGYTIPESTENQLFESYSKGLADIRKYSDMGDLLLSEDAIVLLGKLNQELAAVFDLYGWEQWDAEKKAISNCLLQLRVIAKRDLKS